MPGRGTDSCGLIPISSLHPIKRGSRIKRILRMSPILCSTLAGGGVHCQKRRKRCRKLSTRSRVPQLSLYSWNSFSCRSYTPPIYLFLTTKFNLLFTRRSSLYYNQRHNRPRHYIVENAFHSFVRPVFANS